MFDVEARKRSEGRETVESRKEIVLESCVSVFIVPWELVLESCVLVFIVPWELSGSCFVNVVALFVSQGAMSTTLDLRFVRYLRSLLELLCLPKF